MALVLAGALIFRNRVGNIGMKRWQYLVLNIVVWVGVVIVLRTLYLQDYLKSLIYLVLCLVAMLLVCRVGEKSNEE